MRFIERNSGVTLGGVFLLILLAGYLSSRASFGSKVSSVSSGGGAGIYTNWKFSPSPVSGASDASADPTSTDTPAAKFDIAAIDTELSDEIKSADAQLALAAGAGPNIIRSATADSQDTASGGYGTVTFTIDTDQLPSTSDQDRRLLFKMLDSMAVHAWRQRDSLPADLIVSVDDLSGQELDRQSGVGASN